MTRVAEDEAMNEMLKKAPNAEEAAAVRAATDAANKEHDAICNASNATATLRVYESVIDAAKAAYQAAGGRRELIVAGRGNSTHPVCRIECGIARLR